MIWEVVKFLLGLLVGFIILIVCFVTYGIMINRDEGPLSKRKKAFGILAAIIVFGLGVWSLYAGITAEKFFFAMGIFIVILSIVMVVSLLRPGGSTEKHDEPIDYGC